MMFVLKQQVLDRIFSVEVSDATKANSNSIAGHKKIKKVPVNTGTAHEKNRLYNCYESTGAKMRLLCKQIVNTIKLLY
jgi:hypothetical protein